MYFVFVFMTKSTVDTKKELACQMLYGGLRNLCAKVHSLLITCSQVVHFVITLADAVLAEVHGVPL